MILKRKRQKLLAKAVYVSWCAKSKRASDIETLPEATSTYWKQSIVLSVIWNVLKASPFFRGADNALMISSSLTEQWRIEESREILSATSREVERDSAT